MKRSRNITARTDGDVGEAVSVDEPIHVVPDVRQPPDEPPRPVLGVRARSPRVGDLGGTPAAQQST